MVAELARIRIPTSVQYHCVTCSTDFCLIGRELRCPNCESRDLTQIIIIYQEDDGEFDSMLTKSDWNAGD